MARRALVHIYFPVLLAGPVAALSRVASHPIAPASLHASPKASQRLDLMPRKSTVPQGRSQSSSTSQGAMWGCTVGAAAGAVIGYLWGYASGKEPAIHLVAGTVAGALLGTSVGAFLPAAGGKAGQGKRLVTPVSVKIQRMAQNALHIAAWDLERAAQENSTNATRIKQIKGWRAKAKDIMDHIEHYHGGNVTFNHTLVGELHGVVAVSNVSEMLSAETAYANDQLLTAHDVAYLTHGMKGEDKGCKGVPNHTAAFQGDMVPADPKQLELFRTLSRERLSPLDTGQSRGAPNDDPGQPWDAGIVKYCFAPDVSQTVKDVFVAATGQYSRAITCISFVDVGWKSGTSLDPKEAQFCKESPAIFVMSDPNSGCYSYVGMIAQWPSQQLQLNDPGCVSIGMALHELTHAMGQAHEHARPDRDAHVQIMWDNVPPSNFKDFNIVPLGYTGLPYDVLSVMHYDAYAFALDTSKPTIVSIDADGDHTMGNRVGISQNDAQQMATMYSEVAPGCGKHLLAGNGCINMKAANGSGICSKITQCSSEVLDLCCACGGGIKVQCYQGQTCPQSDPLPAPPGADCLQDATSLFSGSSCVIINKCSSPVTWKCSSGCQQTSPVGGYMQYTCNQAPEVDICQSKATSCTVVMA
jgi:uncharacterized protein YcfJ